MAKRDKLVVPLWDEGGHTILSRVEVRGTRRNIGLIRQALEKVTFPAPVGGEAFSMAAALFIRKYFDRDVWRLLKRD